MAGELRGHLHGSRLGHVRIRTILPGLYRWMLLVSRLFMRICASQKLSHPGSTVYVPMMLMSILRSPHSIAVAWSLVVALCKGIVMAGRGFRQYGRIRSTLVIVMVVVSVSHCEQTDKRRQSKRAEDILCVCGFAPENSEFGLACSVETPSTSSMHCLIDVHRSLGLGGERPFTVLAQLIAGQAGVHFLGKLSDRVSVWLHSAQAIRA